MRRFGLARGHPVYFPRNPYAFPNPRRRIGRALTLGPDASRTRRKKHGRRAQEMLRVVGMESLRVWTDFHTNSPAARRQRIGIARGSHQCSRAS